MKIVVLNCYSRNSLAVINSLDPSYEIIGGAARKEKYLLFKPDGILKSKRLHTVFRYADPMLDPEGFKNDIVQVCEIHSPEAIIPTGTTITNFLSYYKGEIGRRIKAKLLVEDFSRLSHLADKWHTYELCQKVGIPTPKTVLLNGDPESLSRLRSLTYPVVVKPRISYAAKGVIFCQSWNALENYMNHVRNSRLTIGVETPFIVQESIQGELRDVTTCSKDGRAVSLLSQQRLVSLYDFGGGGIINKTTIEPVPMQYAEEIIRFLKWNGIILFDFIKDKAENYYLLECNPKIWGTTQLTIDAGLNVVQQLVDLFVLGKEVPRKNGYEVDLVYRWLFPECVYHWFQNPRTCLKIIRRMINTFRRYNARRSLNNLNRRDLLHLLGIIMDKGEL